MSLLVIGGAAAGPCGAAAIEALTQDAVAQLLADDDLLPVASAAPRASGHRLLTSGLQYSLGGATLRSFRAAVGRGSAVRWAKRTVAAAKAEGAAGLLLLEGIGGARRPHGAPPVAQMHGKRPAQAMDAALIPLVPDARRSDLLEASAMLRTLVSEAERADLPLSFLFVYASGSVPHDALTLAGALAQVLRVAAPAQAPAYWHALIDAAPTSSIPTLFQ